METLREHLARSSTKAHLFIFGLSASTLLVALVVFGIVSVSSVLQTAIGVGAWAGFN